MNIVEDKVSKHRGRPARVSNSEDFEERIKIEEKLRESEAKYRLLFESNISGVGITDQEGKVFEVNDAWCKITGYTKNDMIRTSISAIYANPDDRTRFLEILRKIREIRNFKTMIKRKNGEMFWASLSARIIQMDGGEERIITGIVNINAIKKAEVALKHSYQEAVQVSKIKTDLLTFASHGLQTPLIPIIGWSGYVRDAMKQGENISEVVGKDEIESIYRSAKRLEIQINHFLDLSRIETNRFELNVGINSIKKIVEESIEIVIDCLDTRNTVIYSQIEDAYLQVDAVHVRGVIVNILSNAFKYSLPGRRITISSKKDENFYIIFIKDEGFGFTVEELQNVWQLYTLSNSKKKPGYTFSGTGVGLYLSKNIMEFHGGTIEITSPGRDQGSTVILKFPNNGIAGIDEIQK